LVYKFGIINNVKVTLIRFIFIPSWLFGIKNESFVQHITIFVVVYYEADAT